MSDKIMVFVPMYNCEKQIVRVLRQCTAEVANQIAEIVVVNNRSTDNGEQTAIEVLQTIGGVKVTLLRNDDNYGLGGSHKVAIEYGMRHGYDFLMVLHGDDQGDIRDILPYLQGEYAKYDCLLGARFLRGSRLQGYSWIRTLGNHVYNFLFSLVSGHRIYDLGSGLNLYKLSIFKDCSYHKFPDGLTFNYCLMLASIYYRHRIHFFPISWREEDQSSNVKLFRQSFQVLDILRSYAMSKAGFLERDHRSTPIEQYSSETMYTRESSL